jgi:hypothetical protein
LEKGKLNNSDNPIGRDTIGRAMQQRDNACFYELSSKRRVIQTSSIATRKAGGTMMASLLDVVAVIAKCKKADLLQVCQCKQPKDL